ncbi:MAG TPA: S9 family peptidase [Sphingomonas sp.]|uniref:S9 family peptidase n=1 Tax=Sphingomonas sp. TaxID=28214 RepID=UPI002C61BC6E|nr:S9 family peptidase [Sphingomonas sp.]HMI18926.1 S9 family peptidase [Sphingomonas sp.]
MIGRAATFALAALATAPLGATHPIGPDDYARVAQVGDPRIDPSGQWVAYTVETTDVTADKHVTHLWMTRWDGSRTIQLTGRDGESESSPRFSPDGRWIAFISGRGDDHDDDQLWLMDRAGGEGVKLPGITGSVVDLAWSPDSKTIALIVEDPDPDEKANAAAEAVTTAPTKPDAATPPEVAKPVAEAKAGGDKDEKKPKPIVIDRFRLMQDVDGFQGKQRKRLWLYDLATHTARRLTTGLYDEVLPAWSPDGTRIAFTSKPGPDPDRTYDSNLYMVSVGAAPAEARALTTFKGADQDEDWGSYPAWSPDGKHIAYLQGGPVELFSYGVRTLALVSAIGGAPTLLTPTLDRNVTNPFWSKDGRTIGFTVEDDGTDRLAEVVASGGRIRPLAGDPLAAITTPTGVAGKVAFLMATSEAPDEVFVLDGGKPRQLSHQNDAWLKEVAVAPVARTSFRGKDGTEIHGFLVTPPSARPGAPLPTILFNHGGPQSQFTAASSGWWMQWQIFAAAGYAVVSSNPRGSTGRGEAFAKALYADWGGPAVPDALAAVDDAVARGIADRKRLYVGGWSYGGMLTNYLIASDTRFRAAVTGASISNILAGYGTDEYVRDYEMELGQPWQHMDVWLRNSYPFYHNDRIVTPTLFMVGDKDMNVPMLNSEQMYQALKSRGVDSELVIYPGQFHGFTRPSFLKDRMERWLAWYRAH